MVLNELVEVLLWKNIKEYIDFYKENDAKYYPDNPNGYFKQRNNYLIEKIKIKENFINLIEDYSINGKAVWQGKEQESQNCDNMRRIDIADAFKYGSYERGEELFLRYKDVMKTWAVHLDDYGKAVNHRNNMYILELSIGAGFGTYAAIKNLLPDNRMISIDVDFRCVKNADGMAKYFKVDDRVCGLNANFWFLPFEDNIFDTICTHYGLDESREIPVVLKEASRVLKDGGRFVVIARKYPYDRHNNIMGLFDITEQECNLLLKKARLYSGFDDLIEIASLSGLELIDYKIYEPENSHHRIMYMFQK